MKKNFVVLLIILMLATVQGWNGYKIEQIKKDNIALSEQVNAMQKKNDKLFGIIYEVMVRHEMALVEILQPDRGTNI